MYRKTNSENKRRHIKLALFICGISLFFSCKESDIQKKWTENSINEKVGGKKEGLHISKDSLGNIRTIANYVNDKAEGIYIWFYPNGRIEEIATFKEDVRNGLLIVNNPDGSYCYRNFKDDVPYGVSTCYYKTGQVEIRSLYTGGDGYVKRFWYDKHGKIVNEASAPGWEHLKDTDLDSYYERYLKDVPPPDLHK